MQGHSVSAVQQQQAGGQMSKTGCGSDHGSCNGCGFSSGVCSVRSSNWWECSNWQECQELGKRMELLVGRSTHKSCVIRAKEKVVSVCHASMEMEWMTALARSQSLEPQSHTAAPSV